MRASAYTNARPGYGCGAGAGPEAGAGAGSAVAFACVRLCLRHAPACCVSALQLVSTRAVALRERRGGMRVAVQYHDSAMNSHDPFAAADLAA
jgi:hypothetical protein